MKSESTKNAHIIIVNQELRRFITETMGSMNLTFYFYDSEDDFLSRLGKLELCDLVIYEVKHLYVYDMRIVKHVKQLSLGVSILLITSYRNTRIALEGTEEEVANYAVNSEEETSFLQTVVSRIMGISNSNDKLARLSEEEQGILKLITEGKSTKEIANLMKCPIKDIKCYRLQITQKLEIPNVEKVTPKFILGYE